MICLLFRWMICSSCVTVSTLLLFYIWYVRKKNYCFSKFSFAVLLISNRPIDLNFVFNDVILMVIAFTFTCLPLKESLLSSHLHKKSENLFRSLYSITRLIDRKVISQIYLSHTQNKYTYRQLFHRTFKFQIKIIHPRRFIVIVSIFKDRIVCTFLLLWI